jgi:hypothetical protein
LYLSGCRAVCAREMALTRFSRWEPADSGRTTSAARGIFRAAPSTTFEPALLKRVRTSRSADACGPMGDSPGPTKPPYVARRRFAKRLSVHRAIKAKARRSPTPCHSQLIAHGGPCGKARVMPQNRWPRPEPAEIGESPSACVVVGLWIVR